MEPNFLYPATKKLTEWRYSECTAGEHMISKGYLINWDWDICAAILQTHLKVFSWMTIIVLWFEFHRNLILRVQLTNMLSLVQIIAGCQAGNKPLFEALVSNFADKYIYVTLSRNELKQNDLFTWYICIVAWKLTHPNNLTKYCYIHLQICHYHFAPRTCVLQMCTSKIRIQMLKEDLCAKSQASHLFDIKFFLQQ